MFYENVHIALLHYQADVKSFPLEFRHRGVGVSVHMATCSLMVLLISLHCQNDVMANKSFCMPSLQLSPHQEPNEGRRKNSKRRN